jgi:hypothetical protein
MCPTINFCKLANFLKLAGSHDIEDLPNALIFEILTSASVPRVLSY